MIFGPEFGTCDPGTAYVDRPGAYAIIHDGHGNVAVVESESGLHLPGGGSEPGERPEQTLARELLEECGWTLSRATYICSATQYVYTPGEGHFAKRCAYYLVQPCGTSTTATEAGCELRWLKIARAEETLLHESHRWALRQAEANRG